jgi:hypothetical protein
MQIQELGLWPEICSKPLCGLMPEDDYESFGAKASLIY